MSFAKLLFYISENHFIAPSATYNRFPTSKITSFLTIYYHTFILDANQISKNMELSLVPKKMGAEYSAPTIINSV